jgi:hypothetical protein
MKQREEKWRGRERTAGFAEAGTEGVDEREPVLQVGDRLGAAQGETQNADAQYGQRNGREGERLDLVRVVLSCSPQSLVRECVDHSNTLNQEEKSEPVEGRV